MVIAVLLISSVAGVLFVKKYVCGGRSVGFLARIVLLIKPVQLLWLMNKYMCECVCERE